MIDDFFIVLVAALFHDTGQFMGDCEGHEEKSVQLMKGFLTGKNIDEKLMGDISHCIKVKVPCV
jgi:HD superfamily phosphodiesterase